jgi:multiple sugar transport system permease protein
MRADLPLQMTVPRRRAFRMRRFAALAAQYIALGVASFIALFPLLWMTLLAFKERPASQEGFFALLLAPATLDHFRDIVQMEYFGRYLFNSVFVATLITAANLAFCLASAYAFARKEFRGKRWLFFGVLGALAAPAYIVMIPLYRMMVAFSWINTYWALIAPWLVSPFGIFLLRQYISSLPRELEDAAQMDGASQWRILFRIVAPLCGPALTALALSSFLASWNSFLFPFLFANTPEYRTLTVGLATLQGKQTVNWSQMMAGASLAAFPVLLLFIIFQKRIVQGLTAGAVKE